MLPGILISALAAVVGAVVSYLWVRSQQRQRLEAAHQEAERIRQRVRAEAQARTRRAEAQAREEALAKRQRLTEERQQAEDGIIEQEAELAERQETFAEERESFEAREAALEEKEQAAQHGLERAKSIRTEAKALRAKKETQLEERAGQDREQCRDELAAAMVESARAEAADQLRHLETEPGAATIREAKRILGISIGRIPSQQQAPRQTYNVEVTAAQKALLEDPALQILGRLQDTLGVQCSFINDDKVVRVETGVGVARVTARRALDKILSLKVKDPDKVQALIETGRDDIQGEIVGQGKKALKNLGLEPAHAEITELLGRLYFRTSYTQNQWEHVQEAAYLAGLMAAELGLDVKLARRATLLHDIGKALTHEVDGSHALIGADIARRCGEPPEVVAGIGEHHNERPITSVYSLLVAAADSISGARPGARRELVETYGERIQELERLARSFQGVTGAHAVQAGREVRVQVDEKSLDDQKAATLATEIANDIAEKLTFPGQIRVTVIREFSAVEIAS